MYLRLYVVNFLRVFCFHLQEVSFKTHKASKVLILGNMKMLFTTGTSRWNDRQIALWDQVRGGSQHRHPDIKVHIGDNTGLSFVVMPLKNKYTLSLKAFLS